MYKCRLPVWEINDAWCILFGGSVFANGSFLWDIGKTAAEKKLVWENLLYIDRMKVYWHSPLFDFSQSFYLRWLFQSSLLFIGN